MEVTTRLMWIQEKVLGKLLGNTSLTILYKSGVHESCTLDMTKRCSHQGSTMTEVHLKQDVMGIKNDSGFIKNMVNIKQHRKRFLSALQAYRPSGDLVSEVCILLVGPVGSEKSSFFNSVKSAFYGHSTRQAAVRSDETSITKQYRIYSVKDGEGGKTLPFTLCDSMGLDEREETGLCIDNIPHILKGYVPDRYQFDPCEPIKTRHFTYTKPPPLKDRIRCVAYVLNINSVNTLSHKMVSKLKQIHNDVVDCGVGQVALLTNVDNCDKVFDDRFLNMTESVTSQSQVKKVQNMFNIPIANILIVSNYASELSSDPMKDALIFAALRQMLQAADDYLENLPLKETGNLAPC